MTDTNGEKLIYKWYMISTVSGKEEKVKETLENKIQTTGMQEFFEQIRIFQMPHLTSKELEKKTRGEQYEPKFINMYKGYIFIKMCMSDDSWYLVRNTQYVTGLIGSSGKGAKPTPISKRKIEEMENKERLLREEFETGNIETAFKEQTIVRVIRKDSPYFGQEGAIIQNDDKEERAFVEIETFGRKTPTQFEYKDLEIIG
ncbi:transcription termination/antitermination protein NusG [Mycoplasma zalophi]|uniref:Transcription termination/antitermination protein NusG n=1 Tax=Mycoplasma zalophi TaxID=191287 RepID=A0ABS6DQF2_9MOLU|nr:transcription termination/antitermination protein NusG [Mycoplasma zalophi]MBU4691234.1 transcription termination/antitermination protein NusG [Mycoplasma zalophi]MBU4691991.1 transcription termination/antitermination protein NusG [Mycoplasma zalophi]